jgi:hypothetical protein
MGRRVKNPEPPQGAWLVQAVFKNASVEKCLVLKQKIKKARLRRIIVMAESNKINNNKQDVRNDEYYETNQAGYD